MTHGVQASRQFADIAKLILSETENQKRRHQSEKRTYRGTAGLSVPSTLFLVFCVSLTPLVPRRDEYLLGILGCPPENANNPLCDPQKESP